MSEAGVRVADPVLQALVDAAVDATAAAQGWLLGATEGGLTVLAASGEGAAALLGAVAPQQGGAGYAFASGQPLALTPAPGEELAQGVAAATGEEPRSLLCVPCASPGGIAGALELANRVKGDRFTIDDVELATLIGGVAGVALSARREPEPVAEPAALAAGLERLASRAPDRYAKLAGLIAALIADE